MQTTAKEQVRQLLNQLPDNATLNDIRYELNDSLYTLYVQQQIELGIQDSREGRITPHAEVKQRFLKSIHVNYQKIVILLFVSLITGCYTSYQEPKSGSVATIEFINDTKNKMGIHTYENVTQCTNRQVVAGVENGLPKKIVFQADKEMVFTASMDAGINAEAFAVAIGATGAEIIKPEVGAGVGAVALATQSNTCIVTIDFMPRNGEHYVFLMKANGNTCSYTFSKKAVSDSADSIQFTTREWTRPIGESGPFCKAQN